MKVFMSWSGLKSKAVAALLKDWLPTVLQGIDDPWMSSVDIAGGANWSASIGEQLGTTDFGIICVTRENQSRPWLNFEAGAISKLLGGAVPLLVDFQNEADLVGGPMSQLQVRMCDKDGIQMILGDINRLLPRPLDDPVLKRIFERSFPDFEAELAVIAVDPRLTATTVQPRKESEKIDELLTIARQLYQVLPDVVAANSVVDATARLRSNTGTLELSATGVNANVPSTEITTAFRADLVKTQREVFGRVASRGNMTIRWFRGKPRVYVNGTVEDDDLERFAEALRKRTGMDVIVRRGEPADKLKKNRS